MFSQPISSDSHCIIVPFHAQVTAIAAEYSICSSQYLCEGRLHFRIISVAHDLTKYLQPLSHRCLVEDLFIFYRYFHGPCSQEIRENIAVPLRRVRITRSSTHSHPFQISLPNPRTLSQKSSFILRPCNLWSVLPSYFPESYSLPSFKSKINKLDLISLSS